MDNHKKKTLEDFMAIGDEELVSEKPSDTIILDEPKKHPWWRALIYLLLFFVVCGLVYTGYRVYVSQNVVEKEQKIEGSIISEDKPKVLIQYVYVDADGGLNLRSEAASSAVSLAVIPNKTKLEVIQEKDGWIKVQYDDKTGWCKKELTVAP